MCHSTPVGRQRRTNAGVGRSLLRYEHNAADARTRTCAWSFTCFALVRTVPRRMLVELASTLLSQASTSNREGFPSCAQTQQRTLLNLEGGR